MSLSYPLTPPATPAPRRLVIAAESRVGFQSSPFTGEQTVYVHQGEWFELDVMLPPMLRAVAEAWIGFLLGLNGREGTFLLGDPVGASPRGSWAAGSPNVNVNGAHAAGVKSIILRDFISGATGKAGDWIQFGLGSTPELHKVVQDFAANGAGAATVEIWPRTRAALSSGALITTSNTVGLWRLKENRREWSVEEAQMYGIAFSAMEAF